VVLGGTVVVDKTMADVCPTRHDIRFSAVPATQLAEDNGIKGLANVILVGRLLKMLEFSHFESLEKAIEKSVPARKPEMIGFNKKALAIGYGFVDPEECKL
jgi:2-oxoglutarate ferredoxin oxidoreductase subunit gamma